MNTAKRNGEKEMAENLIPEIASMLGVELGEKFKIKGENELMTYSFNSDGLQVTYGDGIKIPHMSTNLALVALVNGKDEIVKLPWQPKKGDTFYTFASIPNKWVVRIAWWDQTPNHYALLDKGWVYRSEEEAKAALPAVAAEIGVEYEL